MSERYPQVLGACACSRTKEYCVTRGCRKEDFEWRYSTEGREQDRLRRIVDLRVKRRVEIEKLAGRFGNERPRFSWEPRPISRWLRPERAIAEAWLMNMKPPSGTTLEIIKLAPFDVETRGVP